MKIAILNDVHIGKPLERGQIVRAASHLAEYCLPKLMDHIEKQHAPDLYINLGDLIRSEDKSEDSLRYQQAIQHFTRIKRPVLHLLGNHDIKHMSPHDVEAIWKKNGFSQKSFGAREMNGFMLIWLGMHYQPGYPFKHCLPHEQLTWLGNTLQNADKPCVVFTHCAVDDQDVSGNFFYEGYEAKDKRGFFLENYEEIQRVISGCPFVKIVVQAHLHYFHAKIINKVPYVTCPAMGDNICGPTISHHMPEIYSLLTLAGSEMVFKSFSRDYCFAGSEFKMRKN